jgi:hypothetical protein
MKSEQILESARLKAEYAQTLVAMGEVFEKGISLANSLGKPPRELWSDWYLSEAARHRVRGLEEMARFLETESTKFFDENRIVHPQNEATKEQPV